MNTTQLNTVTSDVGLENNFSVLVCLLLGLSVDGGYDGGSGRGGGLLLRLLSQVLADIRGGVRAFQLRLLLLSLIFGVGLCRSCLFLFDRWRRRGWSLGNGDLWGVQVDAVGRGVVVPVGPRHCVEELAKLETKT